MNNSTVAHRWVHQQGNTANGSNFFFDNETIYSYGSHFPIATIYKGDKFGRPKDFIVFTTDDYSVSTSKHIGHAHSAIDYSKYDVIYATEVEGLEKGKSSTGTHILNVANMAQEITELLGKQARARKHDYSDQILKKLENFEEYTETFNCRTIVRKLTRKKDETLNVEQSDILKRMLDSAGTFKEDMAEMAVEQEEKRKEYEIQKIARDREYIEEWRQGEHGASLYNKAHGKSDLLRVVNTSDGTVVETSKGVRIPLKEGRQLYYVVERIVQTGQAQNFSGEIKIEGYNINSISATGTLRAGCHLISGKEIEAIATKLGWNATVDSLK